MARTTRTAKTTTPTHPRNQTSTGRKPRQAALIPDSRIRPLDSAINVLNERLDTIAEESAAVKTDKATILRLMREHRVASYAHGGRRFARVPGDEKLLISRASGDTNADQDRPAPEWEEPEEAVSEDAEA